MAGVGLVLLLLACVLVAVARGQMDATKGRFQKKDSPEYGNTKVRETNTRHSGETPNETEMRQKQAVSKPKEDVATLVAQTGSTAILHCDTQKLLKPGAENVTVTWIKWNSDETYNFLTINSETYITADKRFTASNKTKDWILKIRYTQPSDEGLYQCQTCANWYPSNSSFVELTLMEAEAVIIGGPRKEVEKPGSPLRLSCFLNNSIEAPDYIFWYHEDRMINYDLGDGATVRDGRQGSELIFPTAQRKHAGNYSCVPSNARQASVEVVFLSRDTEGGDGEGSSAKKAQSRDHIVNMLVLVLALHLYRQRYSLQT